MEGVGLNCSQVPSMLYSIGSKGLQSLSVLCFMTICDFGVMYSVAFLNIMGNSVWHVFVFRSVTSMGIHLIM